MTNKQRWVLIQKKYPYRLSNIKEEISARLVRKLFNYDQKTGLLTYRIKTWANTRIGKQVGVSISNGYRRFSIGGKSYLEHRIIWLHVYGKWPDSLIDHINGNGCDNRLENIREATTAENILNSRKQRYILGLRNVYPYRGKWLVKLTIGGFETKEQASMFAYSTMKQRHGDFVTPEMYGLQQKTAMTSDGESTCSTLEMES